MTGITATHATRAAGVLALACLLAAASPGAFAQDAAAGTHTVAAISATDTARDTTASGSATWRAWVLGTQLDVIGQHLAPFHSPYSGPNSLTAVGDTKVSHAYGVYLGARIAGGVQAYLDIEMVRGSGVSHVTGLGGLTNGDVIRQGTANLGQDPYIARAFLRYAIPLAHGATDTLVRGVDQIPLVTETQRVEITAGRLAVSDLMDLNRYAGSTRLQFQNWGLWQNTAWDFAADTRGYSNDVAIAWFAPRWVLRVASFQMPTQANGNEFDGRILQDRGDQAELTLMPARVGTIVRLMAYLNHGRMGVYDEALEIAHETGQAPDIVADDKPGRRKYGFGLNLEQPLADSGETGVFARLGWDDGATESFAFTEVDRHVSAGVQVSGAHWSRRDDRLGVGAVSHGLSSPHREYLEAGGIGFLLGDGRLDYARETIVEAYYRMQLGSFIEVSPDYQRIWNPGYNRDRGPAVVYAVRLNVRY